MKNLRFCLPRVRGRGAGLGNELIPWARAFIASQVLGAKLVRPAFALNRRGYRRHFGTSSLDWVNNRFLAHALPRVEFTQERYMECGGGDVADAVRRFAEKEDLFQRRAYVLVTEGMWGGLASIELAREFVRGTLLASRYAARNMFDVQRRLDPRKLLVAMHVRLGDFGAPLREEQYRGRFNVSLPLGWYEDIATALRGEFGAELQLLIVTDGEPEQLDGLTRYPDTLATCGMADADCSDLLLLASADLLVCSVSSYSTWAAFLSDAPYLWFEPNLQKAEGYMSIWGNETEQRLLVSPTRSAIEAWQRQSERVRQRGYPTGLRPVLPMSLIRRLRRRLTEKAREGDLVRYGVVPQAGAMVAAVTVGG